MEEFSIPRTQQTYMVVPDIDLIWYNQIKSAHKPMWWWFQMWFTRRLTVQFIADTHNLDIQKTFSAISTENLYFRCHCINNALDLVSRRLNENIYSIVSCYSYVRTLKEFQSQDQISLMKNRSAIQRGNTSSAVSSL